VVLSVWSNLHGNYEQYGKPVKTILQLKQSRSEIIRAAFQFPFVTLFLFRYFLFMKLFSLFSSSLKPSWSYSVSHTLWRIVFSQNNLIIGEERNTDEKLTSFFCLDAKTGKFLWSNRTFNEKWWIGIEGVTNDCLYLHGFKKPDMPEHQGIIAVNIVTGTELWQNKQCTFLTVQEPFVYGFRDLFERRLYYKLNKQNGEIIEELESLPDDVEQNKQMEKITFQFPVGLEERNGELWNAFQRVALVHEENIKSVEFADAGKFLVFNIHLSLQDDETGTMKNLLYIIDKTAKKKVYFDVLNESTPYPAPDSFFLDGQTVYYIKERKTLVSLELSAGRR